MLIKGIIMTKTSKQDIIEQIIAASQSGADVGKDHALSHAYLDFAHTQDKQSNTDLVWSVRVGIIEEKTPFADFYLAYPDDIVGSDSGNLPLDFKDGETFTEALNRLIASSHYKFITESMENLDSKPITKDPLVLLNYFALWDQYLKLLK